MEMGPLANKPAELKAVGNRIDRQEPPVPMATKPSDVVEISDNARQRLAEMADAALHQRDNDVNLASTAGISSSKVLPDGTAKSTDGDSEAKIRKIRNRISSGFYDQPSVKNTIADRLIDDLEL